jgi:hypothetical protein
MTGHDQTQATIGHAIETPVGTLCKAEILFVAKDDQMAFSVKQAITLAIAEIEHSRITFTMTNSNKPD